MDLFWINELNNYVKSTQLCVWNLYISQIFNSSSISVYLHSFWSHESFWSMSLRIFVRLKDNFTFEILPESSEEGVDEKFVRSSFSLSCKKWDFFNTIPIMSSRPIVSHTFLERERGEACVCDLSVRYFCSAKVHIADHDSYLNFLSFKFSSVFCFHSSS